jgi:uncharacterized protein (TIGR01777 family)
MIGNALGLELTAQGHQVTILTRGENGRGKKHWDGKDAKKLASLIEGQQAVVNLAGESIGKSRWTTKRKETILSSRLEPGRALAEAIQSSKVKPQVVIQASAIGYYGTGDDDFDESSPAGADWLSGVCQKWEGSLAVIGTDSVRKVIIRSGVVLARQGGVLAQLVLPVRFFIGGRVGSGQQWTSWIHLNDEVRAIRFLMETEDCQGVYNLTAPDPVTNQEMEKILVRVLHKPYWFPVPAVALRLVLGEMSTLILEGQRVLPVRLLQKGFKFNFPDLEPALKDLLTAIP